MTPSARPTVAVWKFASCDGCQLSILDCEEELLTLAGTVRIAHFLEMTKAVVKGPYDLSLVEGSITTSDDIERIKHVRSISRRLITIGACATAGGIQGLRNFAASGQYANTVYAHPDYIKALDTSTPIAAHVPVDLELYGCPSTAASCSVCLRPFLPAAVRGLPPTVCARNAKGAAPFACSCLAGRPVLAR